MPNKLSLLQDIIPGQGIKNLVLGTHIVEILPDIKEVEFKDISVKAFYPRLYEYTFKNSLSLAFDLLTGKLVKLRLFGDYSGLYVEKFGIGSSIQDLLQIRNDVFVDDEYILIGEDNGLIIMIDQEKEFDSIEEVTDAKVKMIIIEQLGWKT